jgi:hypothetical protein
LHLGLDALSNQKILKGIYYWTTWSEFFEKVFIKRPVLYFFQILEA